MSENGKGENKLIAFAKDTLQSVGYLTVGGLGFVFAVKVVEAILALL